MLTMRIYNFFREFLAIQKNLRQFQKAEVGIKLNTWLHEIQLLFDKMNSLKEGIQRWEDLLKKKKRELIHMKNQNEKQTKPKKGKNNA